MALWMAWQESVSRPLEISSVEPLCDTTRPPDCCPIRPLQAEDLKRCVTVTPPLPTPAYRYRISVPHGAHERRADCTGESGRSHRVDGSLSLLDTAEMGGGASRHRGAEASSMTRGTRLSFQNFARERQDAHDCSPSSCPYPAKSTFSESQSREASESHCPSLTEQDSWTARCRTGRVRPGGQQAWLVAMGRVCQQL
ncbi:hypothetical protein LZ31DRAFT_222168 [Colletotrichum somersetense]|nr:hypothetical protein LZ31DRAFT_222168 [Colletotrichum somersetense]